MTIEIGGFLALAALMIGLFAWLRTDISRLEKRIDGLRQEMQQEIDGLRQEMQQEIGGLRQEMHQEIGGLRQEMHQEIGGLRQEMRQEIGGLRAEIKELRVEMDGRLRAVEHGQARLEGLLEGLREAIAGRSAA